MNKNIDPITLAVVRGALETTQREMTMTLEKTARSSVFNVAHDYSNAIFNHRPEMILHPNSSGRPNSSNEMRGRVFWRRYP